ncbi:GHKL domain-containing protein [Enterococcus faecium]|nr:GHKL domain-containing protein [Enterococcus faecium]
MCSLSFRILREKNRKFIVLSVISAVIFSLVYLQFELFATGLLWVYLIAMNFFVAKSTVHKSLISSSSAILIVIFSDYLTLFINPMFNVNVGEYTRFFYTVIVALLLSFAFRKLVNTTSLFENDLYMPMISLIATGTFLIHFIVITMERHVTNQREMEMINSYFVIVYSLLSLFSASIFVFSARKYYKNKEIENHLHYLKQYATDIEKKYSDLRAFKHDYKNMLISMGNYIERGNLEELTKYFKQNILETSKTIFDNSLELSELGNLKVVSLKSIFLSKLNSVDAKRTKVSIFIFNEVDSVAVDELVLVRSLGIILDNAVEATRMAKSEGFIECAILKDMGSVSFIISNSVSENLPPLHQLKVSGYSTKGSNRGLGLSNLDSIVAHEAHLSLETSIQDNKFCQILTVN